MTALDPDLELRQPAWARAWVVAFPVAMAAVLLSGVVPLHGDPGWAMRIFLSAFVLALGRRLSRLAAIGTPDGHLLVRNHWRDRTISRDDITGVDVGRGASSWNRTVHVRLTDGSTVRLDVTETQFGRRRLEEQAAEVRAWAAGRPVPYRWTRDTR